MCGRYSLFETERVYTRFKVSQSEEKLADHYNVAPSSEMPVIRLSDKRHVSVLRWGITPVWAKGKTSRSIINARADTLGQKVMFRKLLIDGRCLIPANGWYEWQQTGKKRYPSFFTGKTAICSRSPVSVTKTNTQSLQRMLISLFGMCMHERPSYFPAQGKSFG